MDWFRAVGERVEAEWRAAGRDEEAFPRIAAGVVAAWPAVTHVDVDAFVRSSLGTERPAAQFAPPGAFGQPGITAVRGDGFVVDVYFWTSGLSAIHDHPFCGLFTLLRGFSVHSTYRFSLGRQVDPRARIGSIELDHVEVLHPGDVRLFSGVAHPLIHSLIHVPNPSVSLVIRTTRTEGYHRYLPPHVALRIDGADPEIERRLALLDHLRRAGDAHWEAHLGRFVSEHPFAAAFQALSRAWPDRRDRDHFRRLVALARPAHGDAVDVVEATVARAHERVTSERIRERFSDPEGRFVATVLAQAETRSRTWSLLRGRYGDDASDRLVDWIDRAGLFEPESPGWHVARWLAEDPIPPEVDADDPNVERYFRGSILETLLPDGADPA